MKILHVIDSLSAAGGAETSLAGMIPLLAERGVDSAVACLYERPGHADALAAHGVTVGVLKGDNLVAKAWSLRKVIAEVGPDVVHASLINAQFVARLACIGLRVPHVNSLVNTTYDPVRVADLNIAPWKFRVLRAMDAVSSRFVSGGFHALTEAVKREAVDVLGIPGDRVRVVPRGRDAAQLGERTEARRERVRESLGLATDDLMLLNVGRQEPQKGKPMLVDAFSRIAERFPGAHLFIAGREGAATEELNAAIARSAARDRVHVLGQRSDVPDLLAAADLFVFPSFYEGLGGSLVEAMGLSVPIIGADAPAVAEVLGHGEYGHVVPRGDVEALAAAMAELLVSPEKRSALAQKGRERFDEAFAMDRVIDQMVEMYEGLAHGPGRA